MADRVFVPFREGDRVAVDRRTVAVVARVMPSGRVEVGDRVYGPDGYEWGRKDSIISPRSRIELLTPELETLLALGLRSGKARLALMATREKLSQVDRRVWGGLRPGQHPPLAEVEAMESLCAVIDDLVAAFLGDGAVAEGGR